MTCFHQIQIQNSHKHMFKAFANLTAVYSFVFRLTALSVLVQSTGIITCDGGTHSTCST